MLFVPFILYINSLFIYLHISLSSFTFRMNNQAKEHSLLLLITTSTSLLWLFHAFKLLFININYKGTSEVCLLFIPTQFSLRVYELRVCAVIYVHKKMKEISLQPIFGFYHLFYQHRWQRRRYHCHFLYTFTFLWDHITEKEEKTGNWLTICYSSKGKKKDLHCSKLWTRRCSPFYILGEHFFLSIYHQPLKIQSNFYD